MPEYICQTCSQKFTSDHVKRKPKFCTGTCKGKAERIHEVVKFNGESYYINKVHGYRRSKDDKILHREKWKFYRGEIPEGYVVHHKDGVKENNKMSNLELIEWGLHTAIHNKQRKKAKDKLEKSS